MGRLQALFDKYGVFENPFPAAGQPSEHPHLRITDIDQKIEDCVQEFEGSHKTQVLVIEGTQGVGKTNLLNYYQRELDDFYQDDKSIYIIRYYPDPEPSFDSIIRKIFQALGENHLYTIANLLSKEQSENKRTAIINIAKSHEVRLVLHSLGGSASSGGEEHVKEVSPIAMEWLLGLPLLKRHKDILGVKFRLDTVESKTQALRDIIYVSVKLEALGGIFLLLDELEKQDDSLSKTLVIRYLSAIRALVDALPTHLFLMMALTLEARRRYFTMLPAMAGRLQNVYSLSPLSNTQEAFRLYELYLNETRNKAKSSKNKNNKSRARTGSIFEEKEIAQIFEEMSKKSAEKGIKGVTHRGFLNELYLLTQNKFKEVIIS